MKKTVFVFLMFFAVNGFAKSDLKKVNEVVCAPASEAVVGHTGKYSFLLNIVETINTKTMKGQGDIRARVYLRKSNKYVLNKSFWVERQITPKDAHTKNLIYTAEDFKLAIDLRELPMLHDTGKMSLSLSFGEQAPKELFCKVFRAILQTN